MTKSLRIISTLAQLCLLTAAADCKSNAEPGLDETSLIQLRQTLTLGADKQDPGTAFGFSVSPVESAQDSLKAAQSNRSIQMHAEATARLQEAKAIWAATKSNLHTKSATLEEIQAERAAAAAVQAAQDEADAWADSVMNMQAADNQTYIADADWTAKHSITKMAAAAAQNATKLRTGAENDARVSGINEQDVVNDAAAEAAANYSFNAKVVAAARVAEQKTAYATWKQERKLSREAQKASWKSRQQSRSDEWKAHQKALKAQRLALKAAAQGVSNIVGGFAPQPYNISNPVGAAPAALIEEHSAAIPSAVYDDSLLKSTEFNASNVTRYAERDIDESISDEKKAKAAYDVAKYAEEVALRNKQAAQRKADAAYKKENQIQIRAAKLARQSRAALEKAKQLAWKLGHTNDENKTAWNKSFIAENVSSQTAEAVRKTTDQWNAGEANVTNMVEYTKWYNAGTAANASALDAQQASEDAMISRVGAGYDQAYAASAKYNYTIARGNLTTQNALKHDAMKASYRASGDARHTAWEAQKWDKKYAAANLATMPAEGGVEYETVESTQTVAVPGL